MSDEIARSVRRSVSAEQQYAAVFIGGPAHGEVMARAGSALDAPQHVEVPVLGSHLAQPESALRPLPFVEIRLASYERAERADTPGRIAYIQLPGVVSRSAR
jgi:hypothetical protein